MKNRYSIKQIASLSLLIFLILNITESGRAENGNSVSNSVPKVNFALLVTNGNQRSEFEKLVQSFNEIYKSNVQIKALEQEQYKEKLEENLTNNFADIYFGFAGNQIKYLYKKGLVLSLDSLNLKAKLLRQFPTAFQPLVMEDNQMLALPIHFYNWGFYYNKNLFVEKKYRVPKSWQDLLQLCQKMKTENLIPIVVGGQDYWPVFGLIDYIDLRMNGLDYHNQITHSNIGLDDAKFQKVVEQFQNLYHQGCINSNFLELDWRKPFPLIYRKKAGIMLMGSFWLSNVDESVASSVGYFSFPIMNQKIKIYEEAPTDVLFVSSQTQQKDIVKKFIEFMSEAQLQSRLNMNLGMLPPASGAKVADTEVSRIAIRQIRRANGLSQFFDRDSTAQRVEELKQIIRKVVEPKK